MNLEQLAIEIPVVIAFALFALQLVKLNNKQTAAFLTAQSKLQDNFLLQLEAQNKLHQGQIEALIKSLKELSDTYTASQKGLIQALQCLASQIEFMNAILLKHDIRLTSQVANITKGLNLPIPQEVINPYENIKIPAIRKNRSAASPAKPNPILPS